VNFIDAAGVVAESGEFLIDDSLARDARQIVMDIVAAYDALAPDWANAPDWAQWCAIDAGGVQCWYDGEPNVRIGACAWISQDERYVIYRKINLSLGIDWRLCKWQRP